MKDMISSCFPPTFEFLNSDSAKKTLKNWLHLNSRRFSKPIDVIQKHFDSKNHEKNEFKNSNVGGKQLEFVS